MAAAINLGGDHTVCMVMFDGLGLRFARSDDHGIGPTAMFALLHLDVVGLMAHCGTVMTVATGGGTMG